MATSLPAPTLRHKIWKLRAQYPKIDKGINYLKRGANYVKNLWNSNSDSNLAYAPVISGPSTLTISRLDPQKPKPMAIQGSGNVIDSIRQYDNFKEKILDRCNEYLKAKEIHQ